MKCEDIFPSCLISVCAVDRNPANFVLEKKETLHGEEEWIILVCDVMTELWLPLSGFSTAPDEAPIDTNLIEFDTK